MVLLQVGRRVLVLGDSISQMNCLCQITDADEVAKLLGQIQRDRTSIATSPFTSWFAKATDAFTAADAEESAADGEPDSANLDVPELAAGDEEKQPAHAGLDGLTARVRGLAAQFRESHPKI